MIREAIILAGGLGTRLRTVVSDVPKSMADVNGRPFLEYVFDYLIRYNIGKVVVSTGYKGDMISGYFGKKYRSLDLSYAEEKEPLGTGGGIRNAFRLIKGEEAFVMNGDSLFSINLEEMDKFHHSGHGLLTLALRYLEDTGRYGAVRLDISHRIKGFTEKKENGGPGYINGGVYILNKDFITGDFFEDKFSIEKDCFEKYYMDHSMLGFVADGYFLDIGIPEDYERAQHEFQRLEY